MTKSSGVPPDARCAQHPESPAIAACHRCGTFTCAQDTVTLGERRFCAACAARPDVDYLEAFRLQYWGRRDGWAWLLGASGVMSLLLAGAVVIGAFPGDLLEVGPLLVGLGALGAGGVLFWSGQPVARWLLLSAVLLFGALQARALGAAALFPLLLSLAILGAALTSTRTRLFLRLEVSRAALQKAWALLHDNPIARTALALGVFGLLSGVFAPLAIVTGVLALRRVDPSAYPPIGGRGQALAGLVLGVVGTLLWGGLLVIWRRGGALP